MNLKDTFVLTEGFEVFRFSGLAPCENSLDAEFKLALQKLRHSHSSVIIPPTVYNCGNKPGPRVCSRSHTHDTVSVRVSAIPVLFHSSQKTLHTRERGNKDCSIALKTAKQALWVGISTGLAGLGYQAHRISFSVVLKIPDSESEASVSLPVLQLFDNPYISADPALVGWVW